MITTSINHIRSVHPLSLFSLYRRSSSALRYADQHHGPGLEFAHFGRQIGKRLLLKCTSGGLSYSVTPVSSMRYFEFPFALGCLSGMPNECLDVSSPRLFTYYVAEHGLVGHVDLINPDPSDASLTAKIGRALNIQNITVKERPVDSLADCPEKYDCIWAISVIEHIAGQYDDSDAIKFMYGALKNHGSLILTIPVDKTYWEEFRDGTDPYGTQPVDAQKRYFFQRYYDLSAIQTRLLDPIGLEPIKTKWFGEKTPGEFQAYIRRWIEEGNDCAVDDPRHIVDNYQEYTTWEEMPGEGVCGLCIQKRV